MTYEFGWKKQTDLSEKAASKKEKYVHLSLYPFFRELGNK